MPTIKLTDRLGFEIDAEINPDSSIARYINRSRCLRKHETPTAKDKELFDSEAFGDPIAIADNQAYVGLSTTATLSTGLAHETGNLNFGFNGGSKATLSTFHIQDSA